MAGVYWFEEYLPCPMLRRWRLGGGVRPASVADDEAAKVLVNEVLDQLGTVEPEHSRMDGKTLRGFDRKMNSRFHLRAAHRL